MQFYSIITYFRIGGSNLVSVVALPAKSSEEAISDANLLYQYENIQKQEAAILFTDEPNNIICICTNNTVA